MTADIKDTSDDTFDLCLNSAKDDLVLISPHWHTKIESFLKIEKFSGSAKVCGRLPNPPPFTEVRICQSEPGSPKKLAGGLANPPPFDPDMWWDR